MAAKKRKHDPRRPVSPGRADSSAASNTSQGDSRTVRSPTPETLTLPPAIRAAAEREMFAAAGQGIVWAVIDTGIHARHPHFQTHQNLTLDPPLAHRDFTAPTLEPSANEMEALVDLHGNGTHAAGLIAGELRASVEVPLFADVRQMSADTTSSDLVHHTIPAVTGIAPRCRLVSLKVLDDSGQGRTSAVIEALEWVRHANAVAKRLVIHGVNLGLGYEYDPEQFACGQSPICVAVNNLVQSGVVVVVAAGNTGFGHRQTLARVSSAALPMSINDPGNAEDAITVGSTHSTDAHRYGVSYFSSKGPTADGRVKPDLVAPGERMLSCAAPGKTGDAGHVTRGGRYVESTGTSSATAVVSGIAAALLSARPELIGQPALVKQLLTSTAEDLQRDRNMQGHGLVNLMRALVEASAMTRAPARAAVGALDTAGASRGTGVPASPPASPSLGVARPPTWPADAEKRFAVAVSYPGERRDYVKKVIWALRDLEMPRGRIFYDRFHEAELVGPNLDSRLQRIYHDDSELIVIFISAEYEQKDWCGLEWRAIRDIIKRRQDSDVMPLRFDDTEVPGLFSIDGYIDLRKRDPEQVADLINDRLALNRRRKR